MEKIDALFQKLIDAYQEENTDLLLIYYNLWQYYKSLNESIESTEDIKKKASLLEHYASQTKELSEFLDHKLKAMNMPPGKSRENLPEIDEKDPHLPLDLRIMIEQWNEERVRFSGHLRAVKKTKKS